MSGPEPEPRRRGSPTDQRRERRSVSMQGHLVRAGGVTQLITLTDLNYGGCGIQTTFELVPGEDVKVSVRGRGSIAAEVRWYADGKAGLIFEPVAAEAKEQIERRAARLEVPGEVALRVPGHNNYHVRVLDLSTDGCRVELVERPSVGDIMMVKFEGLEVMDAEACWVEGFTAGLKFDRPIHPAVLDLLVKRLAAN